jgi:sugar phosphate isomerase/epimerase
MAQPVIALQLYGVRKHMADAEGTVASLQKVADIGYKWVEVAGLGGMTAPDFAAACEDIGLQIISSHESWEELCSNPEAAIEKCKTLGLKFVASGSPRDYHSAEGYAQFAEETTPMAQALAAAGITYMYHNHAHEYAAFGGRTGMEIMAENGDPEYFRFQLDVHWVQRGGASPVAWINKLGSRIATLHCKDMGVTPQSEPLFEPVGTGNLDWPGIIAAAQAAGIGYYIVEQDTCQLDEFESAAISYDNLEEWLG